MHACDSIDILSTLGKSRNTNGLKQQGHPLGRPCLCNSPIILWIHYRQKSRSLRLALILYASDLEQFKILRIS
jgi:hypothetical protein